MEVENIYGVKVGDFFYMERHCFIRFFQVVALKGTKQVLIKEVERKVVEKTNENVDLVVPDKDNFSDKESYIENNNLGATKIVKKWKNSNDEEKIYISFNDFNEFVELWDGTPKKHEIIYY